MSTMNVVELTQHQIHTWSHQLFLFNVATHRSLWIQSVGSSGKSPDLRTHKHIETHRPHQSICQRVFCMQMGKFGHVYRWAYSIWVLSYAIGTKLDSSFVFFFMKHVMQYDFLVWLHRINHFVDIGPILLANICAPNSIVLLLKSSTLISKGTPSRFFSPASNANES